MLARTIAPQDKPPHATAAPQREFSVVGIGASAGGLDAFTRLLKNLPGDARMAYVLVQHLDPSHESILTQLLSKATAMPVHEVDDGIRVRPNEVYVIRPNAGMILAKGRLRLVPRPQTEHHTIDQFFQSLAGQLGPRAIGVILSGTASDGVLGLEAIKAEGGITFSQDEASASHKGMPHSAIAAGCVDFVLPPDQIALELARIAGRPPLEAKKDGALAMARPQTRGEPEGREDLRQILELVRNRTGVDFSGYKSSTLQRRMARRMVLRQMGQPAAYVSYLRKHPDEVQELYQDLLIGVTDFFRDPEVFDLLKRKVCPHLLRGHTQERPVRIWVAGCSTGQEAYSLAMVCAEFAALRGLKTPIQIFATDLNDTMLAKARAGLYAKALVKSVSPERLRRFFVEESEGYRIDKPIREMCVFARHNLLNTPPFSRMDLVACRNLMIYLDPDAQQQALDVLYYALNPDGFLVLGKSESVGARAEMFTEVDKRYRIYSRKPSATPRLLPIVARSQVMQPTPAVMTAASAAKQSPVDPESPTELDRILLARYAPPGVVVDERMEVLEFRGNINVYLKPRRGRASLNLLEMARDGLVLALRSALGKARKSGRAARREAVVYRIGQQIRQVNLEVIPLGKPACFLVVFEPAPTSRTIKGKGTKLPTTEAKRLRRELAELQEQSRSVLERHGATVRALQTVSEEFQSNNEELQSVNEELETSKEELESSNEELNTLNEEMAARNVELDRLNADLNQREDVIRTARDDAEAIIATVPDPLLILDGRLRVQTANAAYYKMFGGSPKATENHPVYELSKGAWEVPALRMALRDVLDRNTPLENFEVERDFGPMGRRTMLLNARPVGRARASELVLLVISDITERKRAADVLRKSHDELETLIRQRTAGSINSGRLNSATNRSWRLDENRGGAARRSHGCQWVAQRKSLGGGIHFVIGVFCSAYYVHLPITVPRRNFYSLLRRNMSYAGCSRR